MYKVLIIDDEPWSRKVVRSLGEWKDMSMNVVAEAEDGRQGLMMIAKYEPHIVITDMRMPGIEGVELLKAINKDYSSIKIIVMSGYDDFVYLKQAIQSRALEYLLKPLDRDELNSALKRCKNEIEIEIQSKTNIVWNIPFVFKNNTMLERYIELKGQVYLYLLELNKALIIDTFNSLIVFFNKEYFENLDKNITNKIVNDFTVLLEKFTSENEIEYENIWNDINTKWSLAMNQNNITAVIEEIGIIYCEFIDIIKSLRKNIQSINIVDVKVYIDKNYNKRLSLDNIAQHFFISKEHLSRIFKAYTGENISHYIVKQKMEKAQKLIIEQGISIKNVAQMIGYDDVAYFYRVFKKYFGLTPGAVGKLEK